MAIAVVAILSGIIIPLVMKSIRDSRHARAKNDLQVIAAAIAHQLKDTGRRPSAAGGPGGASGQGAQLWFSSGNQPALGDAAAGGGAGAAYPAVGNQLFVNLFASQPGQIAAANALFGLPGLPGDEFRYQGPYMTDAVARTSDPWGNAYMILGYDEAGNTANGHIYVVCAGEGGTIRQANVMGAAGVHAPDQWDYAGASAHNLVVQVN